MNHISLKICYNQLYDKCKELAIKMKIGKPKLHRVGRVPEKLKKYEHSIKVKESFSSVEQRYKSLYFEIVNKHIYEIKTRFSDDTMDHVRIMARIIKLGDLKDSKKLQDCNLQDSLIDF